MSHIKTIDVVYTNLAALDASVAALGGVLRRDVTTFDWYFRTQSNGDGTCAHRIELTDATKKKLDAKMGPVARDYSIGVVSIPTGGFKLAYDDFGEYGRRLHDAFGHNLGKIRQNYAVHEVRDQLTAEGYDVIISATPDGSILLDGSQTLSMIG